MAYTRTKHAITVTCKCGNIVAACMILGGRSIEEDYTEEMARALNNGGKVEIINTEESPVKFGRCKCKLNA